MQGNLEFELRLQQYIELVRSGQQHKMLEAIGHARKYLSPHMDTHLAEIHRAAGLLAFPPDTQAEPYKVNLVRTLFSYLARDTDYLSRRCIRNLDGTTLPLYSSKPTTNSSPYRPDRFCTSPCRPACPRSRRHPAIRSTHPAVRTPAPRPHPSAPSARPSSTTWPATCPTPTTPRAMSRAIRSSCRTEEYTVASGCCR